MKSSSRLPLIAAGLAGVLLIAVGLLQGPEDATGLRPEAIDSGGSTQTSSGEERLSRPRSAANALPSESSGYSSDSKLPRADMSRASVVVQLVYKGETAPAAGAQVSLWREQTGEGAAFRPARRLSQVEADSEGFASLLAVPAQSLEIYAQAPGAGPVARQAIGVLDPNETRTVRLEIERPPAPMDLSVVDAESGKPVSGAAIRIVMTDQANLGIEEFPGTTKLVRRTDGDGRASLPGSVRRGTWLLVDAAGLSPAAIDLRSLDGLGTPEVILQPAGKIEALVVDATGAPMADIEVQFFAQLGRSAGGATGTFQTTFTAVTNRRGAANFPRVPVGIPLVPHAGPVGDTPTLFDAVVLQPGEVHELELKF